ncbi:Rieske (2Fe-2S) protein [Paracoccus aminophilus]|uniref:Biphenyl 2,3-dioxygenase n=1 Tax=Paracoccus aminophilus JCM 7686 TaxID=1367847 RepID=S5Z127_PARAH|nr:biphenyl 2,3-dioxygenase [Paracoccus aminophilus]AGT11131.1 biphenyl 2,3-dioxygenase [Paracoccus aminophilus JCM 7686]
MTIQSHSKAIATSSFLLPEEGPPASADPASGARDPWTSRALVALEDQLIWSREWVAIGYAAQIPAVGDILPFTVGNHGIHVERMADGSIAARFNFVQHGGCRSIPLQCQTGTRTRCSYLSCGYSRDRVEGFPTSLNRSDPSAHHFLGFSETPGFPVGVRLAGEVILVHLGGANPAAQGPAPIALLSGEAQSATLEPACNWKYLWQAVLAEFERDEGAGSALTGRNRAGLRLRAYPPNLLILDEEGSQLSATLQPTGINLTLLRLALRGKGGAPRALGLLARCAERAKLATTAADLGRNALQREVIDWFATRLGQSFSVPTEAGGGQ